MARGRKRRRLTAIDLFAGAGGTTHGLKLAGFRVGAAVEFDPVIVKSYRANHANVKMFGNDIRKVDPLRLARRAQIKPGKLDLLNACPPCQGFSSLGNGDDEDDRNDLVAEVWRFTRALRPRAVVVENVPGLMRDRRLALLVRQLRALGYGVRTYVVNATEFGVPQQRRRMILLAVQGVQARALPSQLAGALAAGFHRGSLGAAAVLATLKHPSKSVDPLHRVRSQSDDVRARIRHIPPGGDRFDLPAEHQLKCHKRLKGRQATSAYGRIPLTGPAATMTTRCTTPACGAFVHPRQNRGITLREAALIQTFPRRYRFVGFHQEIERQIGNAVPVRLARGIGSIVRRLLQQGKK